MSSSQSSSGDEHKERNKKSSREDKVFCYCRQPEGNRFMIGCDACNEWFHGECVHITRSKGKEIDVYYCPGCQSKNKELKIRYFEKKTSAEDTDANQTVTKRCTDCINCIMKPDCGECFRCKAKSGRCIEIMCLIEPSTNYVKKKEPEKKHYRKPNREELSDDGDEEEGEAYSLPSTSRKAGGGAGAVASGKTRGRKRGWKKDKGEKQSPKKAKESYKTSRPGYHSTLGERLDDASEAYTQWNYQSPQQRNKYAPKPGPMQCLGRGCIYEARSGSKYCSDECGMRLAKDRIMAYLPNGVKNYWSAQPVAARLAKEDEIRKEREMETLHREKAELDQWYSLVTDYVNSLKIFKPDDNEDERGNDGDFLVSCSVCAVEYGNKVINKHLERCFARLEKQTTYGTNQPCTINPNNIFCEEFNKSNNSYCKRLRVICPEHYKAEIEAGLDVCGWPKVWSHEGSSTMDQLFTSVEGELLIYYKINNDDIISQGMCGISRKECKQHCGWVTTILGLIDNRRLAYFTRVEELCEGKKNVKTGDALLLMSNHTEYHQPAEQIIDVYLKAVEQGGEKVLATVL